eukprot:1161708-Pelagomonas_calceolata.AAC.4
MSCMRTTWHPCPCCSFFVPLPRPGSRWAALRLSEWFCLWVYLTHVRGPSVFRLPLRHTRFSTPACAVHSCRHIALQLLLVLLRCFSQGCVSTKRCLYLFSFINKPCLLFVPADGGDGALAGPPTLPLFMSVINFLPSLMDEPCLLFMPAGG